MNIISKDEDVRDKASQESVEPEHIKTLHEFEEVLSVDKRRIPAGTKRIEKKVSEKTETVSGTLTHTKARVKRIARNTVVDGERPTTRQVDGTTIIPVLEERLIIRKELVLLEEIYVTVEEQTEPFSKSDIVRKEHIKITDESDKEHPDGTTI